MHLSIDDLKGILQCSLQHIFRNSEATAKNQGLKNLLRKSVKESIFYYHEEVKKGGEPGLDDITELFSDIWYQDASVEDVLHSRQLRRKMPSAKEAVKWLSYYLHDRSIEKPKVLMVNEPFRVKIGTIYVTGTFDLIQETVVNGKPRIELVNLLFAKNKPREFYLKTNLDTTIQSYAYRKIHDKKEDVLAVCWIEGTETFQTFRSQSDFKKMRTQVRQALWLARNVPMPRYGLHCSSCEYQKECLEWQG